MTQEQENKINELSDKISQIHSLLAGNKAYNQKGLVHEIHELKEYRDADKKFKDKIIGGIAVGTPVAVAVWYSLVEWWKNKFNLH